MISRKQAEKINRILEPVLLDYCISFELCGSYRRGLMELGDLDYVLVDGVIPSLIQQLEDVGFSNKVVRCGKSIATIYHYIKGGLVQIEFTKAKINSLGAAMLHYTGSARFNADLRIYTQHRGYKLNQYGLTKLSNKKLIQCESEGQLFQLLGLNWIPPDQRINGYWEIRDAYRFD